MNVTWELIADSSGGLFAVSPTGLVVVANVSGVSLLLDYFSVPNSFTLAVAATCVASTSLVGRGTVTIFLNETSDAPVLSPPSQVGTTLCLALLKMLSNTELSPLTADHFCP